MADRPDAEDLRWQSERCPECAFDPEQYGPAEVPAAVGGLGRRYRAPLERLLPGETPDILRARPPGAKWSALGYACHVRDVIILFDGRIQRMLAEANPDLGRWDHEATVEADDYDSQDPAEVADALAANAAGLAAILSGVPDRAWGRTGRRAAGEVFTVLGASRFIIHEGHHHLLDLGRVLRAARGR